MNKRKAKTCIDSDSENEAGSASDIDTELLGLAKRTHTNEREPSEPKENFQNKSSYSETSDSDSDWDVPKNKKRKKEKSLSKVKPKLGRNEKNDKLSSSELKEGELSNSSENNSENSEASDSELEFDYGLDENRMGGEEDKLRLEQMTEKEREQEIYNRIVKREVLKARFKIEKKFKHAKKQLQKKKRGSDDFDKSKDIADKLMPNERSGCTLTPATSFLGYQSLLRYVMHLNSSFMENDDPSSSKIIRISSLNERVNKFLEIAGKGRRKKFEVGTPVTNDELTHAFNRLGRNLDTFNISSIDKEYILFLNIYGSLAGAGFDIYGPSKFARKSVEKITNIVSIQRGFEYRCRLNEINAKKIKSFWLIGGVDQDDEYFINLSGSNKNNIYSVSHFGVTKLFARNFLEFLDFFFKAYEIKSEELYQAKAYDSD